MQMKRLEFILVATYASLVGINANAQLKSFEPFQIKEIQKSLNYLGNDAGIPDGISGPKTESAVNAFSLSLHDLGAIDKTQVLLDTLRGKHSPADVKFSNQGQTEEFVLKLNSRKMLTRYLYPIDLNNDGIEELIIAGFESQALKHTDLSGIKIGIFEWHDTRLALVTDKWLKDEDQVFLGVGDIVFGDFNGDGLTDIFLSAYSDSDTDVNAYALYNEGGVFRRTIVDVGDWQHGATSEDINGDGYTDVFASGYHGSDSLYVGSAAGLEKYEILGDSYAGGSSAAFGRYLSGDDVQLVIVDNARRTETPDQDTNLYRVTLDKPTKTAKLKKISSLPRPIFEHSDWNTAFSIRSNRSHEIRARSVDFNGDGVLDVLVFSTSISGTTPSHDRLSAIQFLQNTGNGVFEDVTDKKLFGFNFNTNPAYSPVLRDLDGDGDMDIFLSEHDYHAGADSTDIILQDAQKRFVSVGSKKLTEAVPTSAAEDVSTILKGPNKREYIVRHTQTKHGYGAKEILKYYELKIIPN